ncbi:hypothetical protein KSS87_017342 [Heliosperma pusillum]|nr:hypothetical protein KSS87_017342 [Heliosperma pusillum]
MLEDQVAYLLQRYLGNYVRGLSKEALKISVWNGDVELTNMQLKPEALNALKLPIKVKAGFLGSVKIKKRKKRWGLIIWHGMGVVRRWLGMGLDCVVMAGDSGGWRTPNADAGRVAKLWLWGLGQDPVLVYLDRIFLLAEPATQIEGDSENAVQEAKRNRIRETEIKLLEKAQHLKTEEVVILPWGVARVKKGSEPVCGTAVMLVGDSALVGMSPIFIRRNQSWLGSLISTIIGNLKLSISNIHIRYEDSESNPDHPFAAGVTLEKLSAFTVDDNGNETFVTGGALNHIQKSVQLERLAFYFDSDITPWNLNKRWEDLVPSEWLQVFKFGTKDGQVAGSLVHDHSYILEPISGNAKYLKLRSDASPVSNQPLQKAMVNLDEVTICVSKDGYRDMLKLAENFAAFNQRLKYAHYRPLVSVKSDPHAWWKYAYKAVADQMKKASGKLSWEQLLRFARLRKTYISLYASLLRSNPGRAVVDDSKEIEELDRELDIDLIVQWRMVAHRFVEQSTESELRKQREKKSWWSLGWGSDSAQPEIETLKFGEDDWERLNKIIGYKESDEGQRLDIQKDVIHIAFELYMRRNASKLIDGNICIAELACESLNCSGKLYTEAMFFDLKLSSYRLISPRGLLAKSAASHDSLACTFVYKPLDVAVDWSLVAKASPCYMTYLKDSVDHIVKFFDSTSVSQTLAVETAVAVQMTIDEMKRSAQEQMSKALKNQSKFVLDLDIAAPKITIPTEFCPESGFPTKLMLDLGNLIIRTKERGSKSPETMNLYLQFDMVLSDVSAFLVDGDYSWGKASPSGNLGSSKISGPSLLHVIEKCGVVLVLQQIKVENPSHPSTRIAVRVPSLGFHFSPSRYHRLMQVAKIFTEDDDKNTEPLRPWNQADFEGWLSLLTWKGVANREAVWQQRYFCLVGPFLYTLESPGAKSYKQYLKRFVFTQIIDSFPNSFLEERRFQVSGIIQGWGVKMAVFLLLSWVIPPGVLLPFFIYLLTKRYFIALYANSLILCSLRGKQIYKVPAEIVGSEEHIVAICDATWLHTQGKVFEQANAVVLRFDSDESLTIWSSRLRGAIYRASASAPITTLSESSSDSEDSESMIPELDRAINGVNAEKIFITGVLDELKVSFSYNQQYDKSFMKMLLSEEKRLFEFRATGGLVEIAIKENDMFIGTLLKSLEIEDLVCEAKSERHYMARSFIRGPDVTSVSEDMLSPSCSGYDISTDGDENFYEASENLPETDSPTQSSGILSPEVSAFRPPGFNKVPGLLPDTSFQSTEETIGHIDELNSFIKAQIVIYDQNSPFYNRTDKMVVVTLATLSFFCRRPTVAAIMDFMNGINFEDESRESLRDSSSVATQQIEISREDVDRPQLLIADQPAVTGLLGKGKSRIMFCLILKMARAQIVLMKDDETRLATLSQDNLVTHIKVFPSSFSIKAAIGNLRISDDSLPHHHIYFWACDMRNPGGSSFVERGGRRDIWVGVDKMDGVRVLSGRLMWAMREKVDIMDNIGMCFTSYNPDDEDYEGFEYSLVGQFSEVKVVFLNRFIQEVVSYFMGLSPNTSNSIVKVRDQVTDSEKLFSSSEIEGSPAVKLDLSLTKPIIIMPRRTDSLDYLELDVVHITVRNTFHWLHGTKYEVNAVHMEIMTVMVDDINLNIGTGKVLGDTIIQEVNGLSIVIRRCLRDLLHQTPSTEATIEMDVMKAALSNREYQIITECAVSNISETPNIVPPLQWEKTVPSVEMVEPVVISDLTSHEVESISKEVWINMKVNVAIKLVELSLHSGAARDSPLGTVKVNNAWLLYKSATDGEGSVSVTLQSFNVLDDREGTNERYRLAIGQPENIEYSSSSFKNSEAGQISNSKVSTVLGSTAVATMLIFDATLSEQSSSVCLCIQRPQLLVALDFLLAAAEFFVPTVRDVLSSEETDVSMDLVDVIIFNDSTFIQPSAEFSLSPQRPLIVDNENFDQYVYDGNGGTLLLKDRQGSNISSPCKEGTIFVGNGKKLVFKNVVIKDGRFLDSCIVLGTNSSYSVSKEDNVVLETGDEESTKDSSESDDVIEPQSTQTTKPSEYVIELQVISPELTFYSTSKDAGESISLSNKLLHAQLDAFCRIVMKGETIEMTANALGLTMESNGIRVLEPFDTSIKFSKVAGKTNIHLSASDILMNFSFSILRLFLAVEEELLSFLRMTSRKMTISCSEFDKVAVMECPDIDQVYAFWRPRPPPGFAVLGDYLTPIDKPPTKAVLAVNKNLVRIRRPESFKLIWPPITSGTPGVICDTDDIKILPHVVAEGNTSCSIWYPVAPKGYISMGCVVSSGIGPPPPSATFCIMASLASSCSLRDCIIIGGSNESSMGLPFWRVDNCVGTFLATDPNSGNLSGGAYDLRHILFGASELSQEVSGNTSTHALRSHEPLPAQLPSLNSGRRFEAVDIFSPVWCNQGSSSRKKLSIWRPVVPSGMVYFGDIAVKGCEPPNSCIIAEDLGDEVLKEPLGFKMVGKINKQRGAESISLWLPEAPPSYVSLGCIACKGAPKVQDFSTLRCIRSDMVTGDQFSEESVWDTSDTGISSETFSIWTVGGDLGTFVVRSGKKQPPKRFALQLAHRSATDGPEDTIIDAEITTFSAACFDDFGGLMVPLFNVSFSGIGFNLQGRPNYLNSSVNFSLVASSYNDKYESWEPVVEAVDGFLRYQYDLNSPGAASRLRLTTTKDLNLNVSSSNANMLLQAYASWNSLSEVQESYVRREIVSPTSNVGIVDNALHKRDYYIIPQNKLGQDIFIRTTELRGLSSIVRMPSGDMKPLKVPVSQNMLDSHLKGVAGQTCHRMVTFIIAEAQFQRVEGLSSRQYTVAIRLSPDPILSSGVFLNQQSARTCGHSSELLPSTELEFVKWGEVFFFKIDTPDSYKVEFIVTDIGKGVPVGFFSAPLKEVAVSESAYPQNGLKWITLSPPELKEKSHEGPAARLKLSVLLSPKLESSSSNQHSTGGRKHGFIQISPTREGPWTVVRLNYGAPAACWRLGNDVVASEVIVQDGNRYVNIRSLVSVRNTTNFTLDVCLRAKVPSESKRLSNDLSSEKSTLDPEMIETVEFFEMEKFVPDVGWVSCSGKPSNEPSAGGVHSKEISGLEPTSTWEWVDEWHIDEAVLGDAGGWAYAPDQESLKWPESYDPKNFVNYVRQRRWVRTRRHVSSYGEQIVSIGLLKPGDCSPLPLSCLTRAGPFVLQLRPLDFGTQDEYAWSKVVDRFAESLGSEKPQEDPDICVSNLEESEKILHCAQFSGTSSGGSHGVWFYLSIQASEIAKDIRADPIQDWSIVVKSPLSITNYLPLRVEYSVLERQSSGHFLACSRGIFSSGKTVNVYSADVTKALYLSLLPQKGWLPLQEAVPISHPRGLSSRTLNLRSSISGRTVQIVLEQNNDKDQQQTMPKTVRIYAPYWFTVARCPPLTFRLVNKAEKKTVKISSHFKPTNRNTDISEEISEDEFHEGYTIASSLNFKLVGLQASIVNSEEDAFGPTTDLSPLGDMDGSVNVSANDPTGNCIRLFVTSKPCAYQSIPTKVISIRPYMTFTNRTGQDIQVKLSSQDEPKVLRASDSRVCFVYRETVDSDKLQICLEGTKWSVPVEILKEDTFSLVLRKENGERVFVRTEVRGYEEGSRFIVVFRLGSIKGPMRIENRTSSKTISIRQCGFGDEYSVCLPPLSTTNFSWDDPYGQKSLEVCVTNGDIVGTAKLDLENSKCWIEEVAGVQFHLMDVGTVKVARFIDAHPLRVSSQGNLGSFQLQREVHNPVSPFELTVEFGVLGLSVVDHRPREISFLYLERVYIAYFSGNDGGTTSRFKLILGHLQIDNQLPLTVMPVLLAPEQTNIQVPVFKMTLTIRNESTDGIQVYPRVYIRVTDKCWRISIHEPIVWAVMDLYNNLQLDRLPQNTNITQVDPEIRIE